MAIQRARGRIGVGLAHTVFVGALALGCVRMTDAPARPTPRPASPASIVPAKPAEGPPRTDTVVLLVIDGARWQDVFSGVDPALAQRMGMPEDGIVSAEELTPNLHALARRGVAVGGEGAPFLASGPNFVSLPGYAEILTGRPAKCFENDCPADGASTLVDDFRSAASLQGRRSASDGGVVMLSSWDRLANLAGAAPDGATISTGRIAGHNLEALRKDDKTAFLLDRGREAAPSPGHGDYRPDGATADLALQVLASARPRFMFLSLGDADERAHDGDYAGYLAAVRAADATLGRMVAEVAGWGEAGRHVTFAVTADHGRCDGFKDHGRDCPESARTFLVMGGGAVPRRGFIGLKEERHLRDIAPTLRALANVARSDLGADEKELGTAIAEIASSREFRVASGLVTQPPAGP